MRLRIELDTGKAQDHPSETWSEALPAIGYLQTSEPPEQQPKVMSSTDAVREAAWDKVKQGRQKWLDGVKDVDLTANDRRTYWIGGALAVYCAITGEDDVLAHNRLLREMPQPGMDNSSLAPGELPLQPKPRERPAPHPGAQRVVEEDDPAMEPDKSPIPEYDPEESVPSQADVVDAILGRGGEAEDAEVAEHPVTITKIVDRS